MIMTDIDEIRELLRHIPCSQCTHGEWVNVGMALHKEGLPCSLWEEWSATDSARYHSGECEKRWRSFGNYGGTDVTMGTVYHMAQDYGWTPAAGMKTGSATLRAMAPSVIIGLRRFRTSPARPSLCSS